MKAFDDLAKARDELWDEIVRLLRVEPFLKLFSDFLSNWKHQRAAGICDMEFQNGVRVWKRSVNKNGSLFVCEDCFKAITSRTAKEL